MAFDGDAFERGLCGMTGRLFIVLLASAVAFAYAIFSYGLTRFVVIFLVSGTVVGALQYFRRPSAKHRGGWAYLAPSLIEWFAIIGVPVFVAFLALMYFFVGSARPDAAVQMLALKCMIVAFSIGGAFIIYSSLCVVTRWNKDGIQQSMFGRGLKEIHIRDIVEVRASRLWQMLRIESADGSVIRVSLGKNGVDDLVEFLVLKLTMPFTPAES
jgi:hypothetical protein